MASYRAVGTQNAQLSDGTILGSDIHAAASLNGKTLSKGSGAIFLKEVATTGEAIQGAREYQFSYGQTIAVA